MSGQEPLEDYYARAQWTYVICGVVLLANAVVALNLLRRRRSAVATPFAATAGLILLALGLPLMPPPPEDERYDPNRHGARQLGQLYYAVHPRTWRWQWKGVSLAKQEYYWSRPWCESYDRGDLAASAAILETMRRTWPSCEVINAGARLVEQRGDPVAAEQILRQPNGAGEPCQDELLQFLARQQRFQEIAHYVTASDGDRSPTQDMQQARAARVAEILERRGHVQIATPYWQASPPLDYAKFLFRQGRHAELVDLAARQSFGAWPVHEVNLFADLLAAVGHRDAAIAVYRAAMSMAQSPEDRWHYERAQSMLAALRAGAPVPERERIDSIASLSSYSAVSYYDVCP